MGNVGDKLCSCNNRDENQDVNMVILKIIIGSKCLW